MSYGNKSLDQSFLDGALDFASLEARHWVADALACHLHNTGYQLEGNTEASDVDWFAHSLWRAKTGGGPAAWDNAAEDVREQYRHTARLVIQVLPQYQLRVAHRLIALSKVVRDIERAIRSARRSVSEQEGQT
jgi:hypothetical protein